MVKDPSWLSVPVTNKPVEARAHAPERPNPATGFAGYWATPLVRFGFPRHVTGTERSVSQWVPLSRNDRDCSWVAEAGEDMANVTVATNAAARAVRRAHFVVIMCSSLP